MCFSGIRWAGEAKTPERSRKSFERCVAIRGHRCRIFPFPWVMASSNIRTLETMVRSTYRVFLVVLLVSTACPAWPGDRGLELFKDVLAKGRECEAGKTGSEVVSCYVKASPSKCESYVYEVYSRRNNAARQAWRLCVAMCADAGLWSRTYGECSRDLD